MVSHAAEKMVCRHCHAVLDASDRFCRQCGVSTADAILLLNEQATDSAYRPPAVAPRPGQRPSWLENVWLVLAMLFLAIGPLALPMLWRSRQFSRFWKIVLTVLVVVYTAVILYFLWWYVQQRVMEIQRALSP